jgi:hypothetical protein
MIRINKGAGYLVGIFLTFLIYLIGQLFFFINTKKADGIICDITVLNGEIRTSKPHYFVCFSTADGHSAKADIGVENYLLHIPDPVSIVYKTNDLSDARINTFKNLWMVPAIYYIIPLAVALALVTGIYYGTKYIIISRRPWKIYLSNEEKEEEWQIPEVIDTTFKL